jgi:hypothetical protein
VGGVALSQGLYYNGEAGCAGAEATVIHPGGAQMSSERTRINLVEV